MTEARRRAAARRSPFDRYFHVAAAVVMLAVMVAGFYPFYLRGEGLAGRKIAPALLPLVVVHGSAMTAWVAMFLVQSLLVPTRMLRLHMKLGWAGIAVASLAATTGVVVAVQSVRPTPELPFWGMAYRQFLAVMLAEMALFTAFVVAGALSRRKPRVHRAMMLLATLSILAGATVRMPVLFPLFGEAGWVGIFGPIFVLGGVLVLVRSLFVGTLERWLVGGYAAMVALYVIACRFAVSDSWSAVARAIFRT
jgi:hypothetical protein